MIKRKDAIARTDKTLRLMRCLENIIESFSHSKAFPIAACFQRSKVYYKLVHLSASNVSKVVGTQLLVESSGSSGGVVSSTSSNSFLHQHQDTNIYLFDSPIDSLESYFNILNNFEYLNSDHVLDRNMIEYFVTYSCVRINSLGKWMLITKIKKIDEKKAHCLKHPLWLIKFRYGDEEQQQYKMVEIVDSDRMSSNREYK